MAKKPTNQGGDSSKQLKSSLDVQQQKLDAISTLAQDQILVLKDILDVMKNIADNIVAGLRSQDIIYAVQPEANQLAEAEKEREANRQNVSGKDDPFKSLKGVFDGLNKGFNFIKIVLIPMLLGFLIGFRKKFDLLTIAIGFVILKPIVALTLLFKAFKGIISFAKNLIPTIKDARTALSNGFRTLADAFSRSNITRIAKQFLSGIQGFFSNLISRIGNATGITKKLSEFFSNIKILFDPAAVKNSGAYKAALKSFGNFGKFLENIALNLHKLRFGQGPIFSRLKAAVDSVKNFFLGIGKAISSKFSGFMNFIKPFADSLKAFFNSGRSILPSLMKVITPLFNALKFLASRIATPILALIGGIKGAIEGFQKEGVIGAIKGAIAGALDMAFDWIFDVIGWVFGKLGFEDAEKALEKYGLGETVSFLLDSVQEFIVKLFEPIFDVFTGKRQFFEGLGRFLSTILDSAKDILEALIGTLSMLFGSDALYNFAEMLKEFSFTDLFQQMWDAIKEWVLDAPKRLLGIGGGDDAEDIQEAKDQQAIQKAAEQFRNTDEDLYEDLLDADDLEEAKEILADKNYNAEQINNMLGIPPAKPTPVPAPSPQQTNQKKLDEATEQRDNLAAARKQPPASSSPVAIAVDNSQKQAIAYHKEIHAAKNRGAPGNLPGRSLFPA
jgi:hypothetical protein